jgi:predicted dehydrogenase
VIPARLPVRAAPSNRVAVGMIGGGRQSRLVNIPQMPAMPDVQIVAVCDVDARRLKSGRRQAEEHYARLSGKSSWRGCTACRDFRELVADRSSPR